MRLSELAATSGVPVATIKYYLRERLLPPGDEVSRTQASYGRQHVARLRLIRSLREVADLPIAAIGQVLAAVDDPAVPLLELLGVTQWAVTGIANRATPVGSAPRATALMAELGWDIEGSASPVLIALERVLDEIDTLGRPTDAVSLAPWVDAAHQVAVAEVATVPIAEGREAAATAVAAGTVLYGELFGLLRSLAQEASARTLLAAQTQRRSSQPKTERRSSQPKTERRSSQPKTERRSRSNR